MPPLTVMIKPVSGACNMRCAYCFYADETAHRAAGCCPPMAFEALERVIRRTMLFAEQRATFVFQGGEPTLAGLSYFEQVVRLQRQNNPRQIAVNNVVQTNGLILQDALIDFFVRERFLIGVSVDGCREIHDQNRLDARGKPTYDRVMANIQRLKDAGAAYNILCVLTDEVARRADAVLDALIPHRYLQFIPCMDPIDGASAPALTADAYARFLARSFERYEALFFAGPPLSIRFFDNLVNMLCGHAPESCAMCGHCGLAPVIESDGSVYPCDFYALDEWKLGNILEMPLRRILSGPKALQFVTRSMDVPEECRQCLWYSLCRNGCYRERDGQTHQSCHCDAMRRFFSAYFPRLERIAQAVSSRR